MTDCAFLLEILDDGEPRSQADLLRISFERRGCGLTIHSRIADLRKQGYFITCERVPGETRGRAWVYQLIGSLSEGEPSTEASSDVAVYGEPGRPDDRCYESSSPSESDHEQLTLEAA